MLTLLRKKFKNIVERNDTINKEVEKIVLNKELANLYLKQVEEVKAQRVEENVFKSYEGRLKVVTSLDHLVDFVEKNKKSLQEHAQKNKERRLEQAKQERQQR